MNNQEKKVKEFLGEKHLNILKIILNQKPEKSDAIIFLQGDKIDRCDKVFSLFQKSFANRILLSGNNLKEKILEKNDAYLSDIYKWFLDKGVEKKKIILEDKSLNTLDQAINVIKIANDKNWDKIILVTSPYHLLRVYLTFSKQKEIQKWKGKIIMQAADISIDEEKLKIELKKIKEYKKNLKQL